MHDFNRMTSGAWYIAGGPEIVQQHEKNRSIMKRFNDLANTDMAQGEAILAEALAPGSGVPETFAPLHLEYGINTTFGSGCFMNFNCIIIDVAPVSVGNNTLFGPGCQLITAEHPVNDVEMRIKGWERARPIAIGDDCWFGAGAMVMPGVTVGNRCVVAAGAVVTKDIPDDSLVMGVPGKVTRTLNQPGDTLEREELEPGEY